MCLLLIANKVHPEYKLIIAANRDEFYGRPAIPAAYSDEYPGVLAGKDLKGGGTWLGITRDGRFSAITNYRDLKKIRDDAPTRGYLTTDFLTGNDSPEEYLKKIRPKASLYNGFNLVCGVVNDISYYSNIKDETERIDTGVYALSNCFLDTPWPKVEKIKSLFNEIQSEENLQGELFTILSNNEIAEDKLLPDTGVGIELERILSSIFIKTPIYGTRCSTIIMIDNEDNVTFTEKSYEGGNEGVIKNYTFRLDVGNW